MMPRGPIVFLVVSAAFISPAAGFGDAAADPILSRHEQTQVRMGTEFRVVLYARSEADASSGFAAAFQRIADLDAMLSDYKDDSELTRLCRDSHGAAVSVSPEFFEILKYSDGLARQTAGAFDVTVGPAVRLWRRARRQRQLPDKEQIERALGRVGYQKVDLDESKRAVRLSVPGMQLDLGGIAKGYACDQALQALKRLGIQNAMVDGGGGISASDPPPGKKAWEIRLLGESSDEPSIRLSNQAIATSGDLEQFIELDGIRYSHIVDPKTGVGLTNRLQVSVVAPLGMTADGLATAMCVLGMEKGMELIETMPAVAGKFVQATATGRKTTNSSRWTELTSGN